MCYSGHEYPVGQMRNRARARGLEDAGKRPLRKLIHAVKYDKHGKQSQGSVNPLPGG